MKKSIDLHPMTTSDRRFCVQIQMLSPNDDALYAVKLEREAGSIEALTQEVSEAWDTILNSYFHRQEDKRPRA